MNKVLLVLIVSLLAMCSNLVRKSEPRLNAVMIRYNVPRMDSGGRMMHVPDTVWFVQYGDLYVYRFPGLSEIMNNDFVHPVIHYHKHMLYKKFSNDGYLFDSINAKTYKRKAVDSFLARHYFGYTIKPLSGIYKLAGKANDAEDNVLETYLPTSKPDRTYPDTTKLYYNAKFNHLFYSFSKELDSTKGMKLFKFRFIYNADDPKKFSDPWPAKEFFWEMQEDTLLNKKEIMDFIQRNKKQLGA
jgi:hypothetical protein